MRSNLSDLYYYSHVTARYHNYSQSNKPRKMTIEGGKEAMGWVLKKS